MIRSDTRLIDDRMVRAAVLADALGLSERAIRKLAEDGVVTRSESSLYPLRDSIRRYCAHARDAAAGRAGLGAGSRMSAEREREVKERADSLAMRNAAARAELLPAAEVEAMWSRVCRELRSRFLAMPSRLQQRLGHLTPHDLATFDREIRDTLAEAGNDRL